MKYTTKQFQNVLQSNFIQKKFPKVLTSELIEINFEIILENSDKKKLFSKKQKDVTGWKTEQFSRKIRYDLSLGFDNFFA